MAERRMFSKQIIDSDAFLDMSASAQALYFHLGMRADDDGFVNNPRKVQRMVGAADDDLKILMAKRFVLMFKSGVIVIKHWRINNYLRCDRYKSTVYKDELALLEIKGNGAYTERKAIGIPAVYQTDTQDRLGKVSLGQDRRGEESAAPPPEPARSVYGEYKNVLLSDDELEKLKDNFPTEWQQRIDRLSEYMASKKTTYGDHLATIRSWARQDKEQIKKGRRRVAFQDYEQGQGVEQAIPSGPDLLKEIRELKKAGMEAREARG